MSTSSDRPEIPEYTAEDDREDVLDDLAEAMEEALRKFSEGRVYDVENEKVRQGWLRAYVSAVGEYRRLVADLEESNHDERIARLESILENMDEDQE